MSRWKSEHPGAAPWCSTLLTNHHSTPNNHPGLVFFAMHPQNRSSEPVDPYCRNRWPCQPLHEHLRKALIDVDGKQKDPLT